MHLDEMLKYIPKELPIDVGDSFRPFCTNESIVRDYDILEVGSLDGINFQVAMKKTKSTAFIGTPGFRNLDGKPGFTLIGAVDFKQIVTLSGTKSYIAPSKSVQVGLVRISENQKSFGWGFELYLSIAKAGYTVISDNTQYWW